MGGWAWTVAIAIGLAGCSTIAPVVGIPSGDRLEAAYRTAKLSEGTFSVSDGAATCKGSYDAVSQEPTVFVSLQCSDGRVGVATAFRDATGTAGHGRLLLESGPASRFVFGPGEPETRAESPERPS